jgi:hypothetical protein
LPLLLADHHYLHDRSSMTLFCLQELSWRHLLTSSACDFESSFPAYFKRCGVLYDGSQTRVLFAIAEGCRE